MDTQTETSDRQQTSTEQIVLVSYGGGRFHLPRKTGDGPVCATTCEDSKGWNEKEYSVVGDHIDPCEKCNRMVEEAPSVVHVIGDSVCCGMEIS